MNCSNPTPDLTTAFGLLKIHPATPPEETHPNQTSSIMKDFNPADPMMIDSPTSENPSATFWYNDEPQWEDDRSPDGLEGNDITESSRIWLSFLPDKLCYEAIIDAYRFRVKEDHIYRVHFTVGAPYDDGNPTQEFFNFLANAKANGVLPDWWGSRSNRSCLNLALDSDGDACILRMVNRIDIIKKYGYFRTSQLKSLAEKAYEYSAFR